MAFEKFTKIRIKGSSSPKVTILKSGGFTFNCGAIEKFRIKEFSHAVLFYDREAKKIGIKLLKKPEEEGTLKISTGKRSSATIAGKSFLKYYEIDISKTTKKDVYYDEKNQLVVIELQK